MTNSRELLESKVSTKHPGSNVVLFKQRLSPHSQPEYVTAIKGDQAHWYWGHYFTSESQAREDFSARS